MPVYRPLQQELLTPAQFESRRPAEPEPIPETALPSVPAKSEEESEEESFAIQPVTPTGPMRPPQPVDFGKPLNIMIRRIYTGKFPEKRFLGGNQKPMLISTTVKDVTTTAAGARAVNVLKNRVAPKSVFNGPGAAEEGTP